MKFNKQKNIGKVLFIVEGDEDEFRLIYKIFTNILGFQFERYDRKSVYRKYNEQYNIDSSVFVINSKNSSIGSIQTDDGEEYLDQVFQILINEYDFPVDRAAIYYIFDRDVKSNTDIESIGKLVSLLRDSRDNGYDRQGLLILSYPAVESFVMSNYVESSFNFEFQTGHEMKQYLNSQNYTLQRITEESVLKATNEMLLTIQSIMNNDFNIDYIGDTSLSCFNFQESYYQLTLKYKTLSLLSIILLDLGLIVIE